MLLISRDGNSVIDANRVDARFDFIEGECVIVVNGEFAFGRYDEAQGKIVFEKILAALKNGERFFDMREVDSGDV